MKKEKSFTLKVKFPIPPEIVYLAWLDSKVHTKMTGGGASCSKKVNGKFSAWDGYISGKNLKLVPGKKIVQSWRTSEFDPKDPDSLLTLTFKKTPKGSELELKHEKIPGGQSNYKSGWKDHYFSPMKEYFSQ